MFPRQLDFKSVPFVDLGLIVVTVCLVSIPFWSPGITSRADMLIGIFRIYELDNALTNGILFPRLGSNFNYGYSAPLFQFYPPLASYLGVIFHKLGLNWILASKAVFLSGLLVTVMGAYAYSRWLTQSRVAGLVSAATLLFAPYMLLLVYERGAAAELLSLAFAPWLFLCLHRWFLEGGIGSLASAVLLVAGLMLAHNITALFLVPVLVLFLVILAMRAKNKWRSAWAAGALLCGLGLTAFYWVPALGELVYTRTETYMLTSNDDIRSNLLDGLAILQGGLNFEYWGSTHAKIGLWQVLVLCAGALVLGRSVEVHRRTYIFFILSSLLILFMLTRFSYVVWEYVPLIDFIRFPWRLAGLLSIGVSIVSGGLCQFICGNSRVGGWAIASLFLIFIAYYAVAGLNIAASPLWYPFTDERVTRSAMQELGRNGFELFTDYEPIFLKIKSSELPNPRPQAAAIFPPLESPPAIELTSESLWQLHLDVTAATPFPIRLHRTYFPGWHARADGNDIPVAPAGEAGIVSADFPAGAYQATVTFDQTTIRRVADWLSSAALIAMIALGLWYAARQTGSRAQAILAMSGILLTLGILLFLPQAVWSAAIRHPVSNHVNFADEIELLGYHIDTSKWQPGAKVVVRLYWFVHATPSHNYSVFLHLADLDDTYKAAQYDGQPIDGYSPTTRWEPGEIIADEYVLDLPVDMSSGRYRLLGGLFDPELGANVPIISATNELAGDRAMLMEVIIGDQTQDP